MEKPDFAPNEFGEIMANCWKTDPNERPTFSQLEEMTRTHLESAVYNYYVDLNFPYQNLNEKTKNCSSNAKLADLGLAKLLDADAKIGKSNSLPTKAVLISDRKKNNMTIRSHSLHPTSCDM